MNLKLPDYFNLKINLKRAVSNGVAMVLFLTLMQVTEPRVLVTGFVFGLLGGSSNDIVGWLGNKEAITAYNNSKKEEDGE